ncbi:MAG: Na/Pi cotransporter family protein [Cryomorphaceae bacterium]|nr:Na/Pi cotransporter family protein [Cryomorphaceae bacterium]
MGYTWLQFIQLLGSVGLFIFGMKVMSDGIQKSAGSKFKAVVTTMTANKYYGLLTGMFATFLLQSSSVTSVIVVGLANAGILNLAQSIGVILGANIGTTITAWLLTLVEFGVIDSAVISFGMVFIGVILLFNKKERVVSSGEFVVGIGLLFIGINAMQMYAPDLQANPELLQFLKAYEFDNTPYFGRLLYLLMFMGIGAIVAVIVQSSTAAVAITLVMTAKGWIPLPFAMALVLGENIGTTATANIAALIGNIQAKRAAFAHFLINALGSIWAILLFDVLLRFTTDITILFSGKDPNESTRAIPMALAVFHTLFNVINVSIFLFAIPSLIRLCNAVFKGQIKLGGNLDSELFTNTQVTAPLMAILRAKKEIHTMVKLNQRTFQILPKMLMEGELAVSKNYLEKVRQAEQMSDASEFGILKFLTKVSEQKLDGRLSMEIRALMSAANYLERSTDLMVKSAYNLVNHKEQKAYFTPEQRNNILNMMTLVEKAMDTMEEGFLLNKHDPSSAKALENDINNQYILLRDNYLSNIEKGKFTIQSGLFYMDILSELERMADHAYNVTQTLAKYGEV